MKLLYCGEIQSKLVKLSMKSSSSRFVRIINYFKIQISCFFQHKIPRYMGNAETAVVFTKGQFLKSWAYGAKHRDTSIHLRSTPTHNF